MGHSYNVGQFPWSAVLFIHNGPRWWERTIRLWLDLTKTGKINKAQNANLTGVLLYDQDQDSRIQYSQALSIGLLFTL